MSELIRHVNPKPNATKLKPGPKGAHTEAGYMKPRRISCDDDLWGWAESQPENNVSAYIRRLMKADRARIKAIAEEEYAEGVRLHTV